MGEYILTHSVINCMCSKCGFYLIISEGIIALHLILFYLYKCHVADELLWQRVGLRDDSRQSRVPRKPSDWRGASEVSAGRTGLGGLVAGGVVQEISEGTDVFLLC